MINLQSVDELLTLAEQQIEEKEYCTVDDDTRVVTVPEAYKMLGVESDKRAKRIWFKFPKLVGNNGLNLMELNIRINYRNAAGDGDVYIVTDKKEESDGVIFSWELSRNATKQKGKVQFVVCAIKTKTDGSVINEWNTKLNSECESLEGLETKHEVEEENPEIIEYILANIGGTVTQEQIEEALKEYFLENPINVPKNLSDLKEDAEHRTVTDTEKQSWNAKSDFSGEYRDLHGKPELAEWALQSKKPTYTASEVGALPDTTEIPKNLSDLQDDAEHRTVTDTEKQSWDNKSDFSGNYEDLQGKPTITIVPTTLPNPQYLTITYGGQTYTYDGSEAVAITIETGGIERIEKLSTDTTVTLEPNKLYVFPEMESLTYTIGEGTGEVHFIFKSGATATRVVHPSNVNIGNFTVDANKVYEVSILEGLLTSQNWSVR